MLILSDGLNTCAGTVYPLLGNWLQKIRCCDEKRLALSSRFLIPIELFLCLDLMFLMNVYSAGSEPTTFMLISLALPAVTLVSKLVFVKRVIIRTNKIKVIGVAPVAMWIEHFLSFYACGLTFFFGAKMFNLDLLGPNIYSLLGCLTFIIPTAIPLLNVASYRIRLLMGRA